MLRHRQPAHSKLDEKFIYPILVRGNRTQEACALSRAPMFASLIQDDLYFETWRRTSLERTGSAKGLSV